VKKTLLSICILLFTLAPIYAGDKGHYENHNGTLYLVMPSGDWSYVGPTPANWKGPTYTNFSMIVPPGIEQQAAQQKAQAAKAEKEFWAWYRTLSLDAQVEVLKDLEENERANTQAERDWTQEQIEMDLSNISDSLFQLLNR
jgi:hypothetical protein